MSETGLSVRACLDEISERLTDAAAIARAAVTCAASGSDREALRIAMDLDELISEAATLHGAMCLIGRMQRAGRARLNASPAPLVLPRRPSGRSRGRGGAGGTWPSNGRAQMAQTSTSRSARPTPDQDRGRLLRGAN